MNKRHCFLVEVGTEELPPKALRALMTAFSNGVRNGLESTALACEGVAGFASPRRLAVKVAGLADRQRDQESEHRGPPVRIAFDKQGAPTRAATGFADSHGVRVDDLERIHTDKGEWLFYRSKSKGASAAALLPSVVEKALDKLPIPRRMRWGDSDVEFVRPVHWIVMLLDKEVLPATLFNIPAGRETFGHRVHAPGPFSIRSAADYPGILARKGYVLADFEARQKAVLEELGSAAMAAAGAPVMDNALLDEVTALVEWPVAVSGSIPEGFLALPDEVLVATLQEHQRYFPLRDGTGALMPAFVAISNLESTRPEKVREGNERVVRPRLADAEFFFSSDRKTPLEKRFDELDGILFHKKLGSLGEKTRRVTALAGELAEECGADRPLTQRAAHLSRCDLVTDMVGEFPELQGTMGRHYAAADGEAPEVSAAIQELYLPRFAGDALPETPAGRALSIADKIDTLVGIFAIGRPPTGTRDPFGLRRAALGVLRITIEHELDVDLEPLLAHAEQQLPDALLDSRVSEDVLDYMLERLRAYYLDNPDIPGVTPEMFDAVSAARPTRPIDFHRRIVDPDDDALRAVVFGYACHNTTMGFRRWLGDYAGYAQEFVEKDHPGVTALFMMGCGGDQNPYPRSELKYAQMHGRSLATAVEAALEVNQRTRRHQRPVRGKLSSVLETVDLEFATPDRPDFAYPVQVIRFGNDLMLVALGNEVVVDYALRLKRELTKPDGPAVWVAGYSNVYSGYIPSKRVLLEGGYEARSRPWKPTLEERIVGKVHELVKQLTPIRTAVNGSATSVNESVAWSRLTQSLLISNEFLFRE